MAKKLYAGNLSYSTSEETLHDLFAEIGTVVSVKLITDRDTGSSKGFGFVEMESDDDAQKAIDQLNGKEVDGRTITVNEARPPRERDSGRGGYGGRDRRGGSGGRGGGGGGGSRGGRGGDWY